jgi:diketogulonate reductase-like aldo/keto reductase
VDNIIQTLIFIIVSAVIGTAISFIAREAWRWKQNVDKQLNQLRDINLQLKAQSFVLKAIVDTAIELRKELMARKPITMDKVIDTISKAIEGVMDRISSAYFELYLTHSGKSSNPDKEYRKKNSFRESTKARNYLSRRTRIAETFGGTEEAA